MEIICKVYIKVFGEKKVSNTIQGERTFKINSVYCSAVLALLYFNGAVIIALEKKTL